MNDFEEQMKAALRRDPAPPDFAAKVLARVSLIEGRSKVVAIWRRPSAWALAAGISIAAVIPPAVMEYQRNREVRALEAKRELFIALTVTRIKLQQTRERIQRTTRHTL